MQNQQQIIDQTITFVKEKLKDDASGHDWWHIYRVHQLAKYIAKQEGADLFVVELAALLHDIADWKFNGGDPTEGGKVARQWLEFLTVNEAITIEVEKIINTSSFKGATVNDAMDSLEGKVLQDADRLDAIGAIGIARTFAYGGSKGRMMYDPHIRPTLHDSFESYKKNDSTTINHFYEKLLLLKDRMHTQTGKALAEERHQFMRLFLKEFYKEWEL